MINKGRLGLGIAAALLFLASSSDAQTPEPTRNFVLRNGLKVFLFERHVLPLVDIVIGVDVGTKDEPLDTSGLIHILEHLILFRGTELRTGVEVGRDIRAQGAYFNGHTDRDISVFELTVPSSNVDFGLRNQREILFRLRLNAADLEEEKQVILEELHLNEEDPGRLAMNLAFQSLFGQHPYQRSIYGTRETISSATIEQIETLYRDYFIPSNCALAVVGDFSIEDMEAKVRSLFESLPVAALPPRTLEPVEPLKKDIVVERELDIRRAYMTIAALGPDYNNPDQFTIDVLTHILGRGVNPLLSSVLRDRRQLADSFMMSYGAYRYGGIIAVSLVLDPKNVRSAQRETIRLLKDSRKYNFSRNDYMGDDSTYALDFLENARNQIRFDYHVSQENSLVIASSLVRYMLMQSGEDRGSYLDNIDSISSSDLRQAAAEYLSKGKYAVVIVKPAKEK